MNEQDPFHDFDLEGLYSEIEGAMMVGRDTGDSSKDSSGLIEDSDSLDVKRVEFLEKTLGRMRKVEDLRRLDIRQTAATFKFTFIKWKNGSLWGNPAQDEFRELIDNTTIEDFANAAENEYNRLAELRFREVPNSHDYEDVSEKAGRWEVISTIVRAASEIKD